MLALAASLLALGLAPLMMPASYAWTANTTSESGAQSVEGAWLARSGFLLLAFGALWVTRVAGSGWGLAGRLIFIIFSVMMAAVTVFPSRPWEAGQPYDQTTDLLHTIAATAIGFSFALGVAGVMLQDGILQRLMFLVAYTWFAREVLDGLGKRSRYRNRSQAAAGAQP